MYVYIHIYIYILTCIYILCTYIYRVNPKCFPVLFLQVRPGQHASPPCGCPGNACWSVLFCFLQGYMSLTSVREQGIAMHYFLLVCAFLTDSTSWSTFCSAAAPRQTSSHFIRIPKLLILASMCLLEQVPRPRQLAAPTWVSWQRVFLFFYFYHLSCHTHTHKRAERRARNIAGAEALSLLVCFVIFLAGEYIALLSYMSLTLVCLLSRAFNQVPRPGQHAAPPPPHAKHRRRAGAARPHAGHLRQDPPR